MAEQRIYKAVRENQNDAGETVRFVRAANQAQVGRHIAKEWTIAPAKAEDMVAHRAVPVETAGE